MMRYFPTKNIAISPLKTILYSLKFGLNHQGKLSLTLYLYAGKIIPFFNLLIFFKINFSKISLRNTIRVSNSLEPDLA